MVASAKAVARCARLPLLICCLAATALAQEEYRHVQSEDGKCSVEVPASWQVKVGGGKPASLLRFEARAEGVDGVITCNVWLLQGQRDIYLQAFLDRAVKGAYEAAIAATPEIVPLPHLVMRYGTDRGEEVEATAYAMVRRNGVNTQLLCDGKAWPRLRDAFLHMARSMQADLEEWPPHPPTLHRQEKDGFVYLVHPSVNPTDLKHLRSLVARTLHRFERGHGEVPMPEENPPLIVVHNSLAEAVPLYKRLRGATSGAMTDELGGRVFLTPVPAERGPERATCVREVVHLLMVQRYGWNGAYWMYIGEGRAAWSEERCGQDAPRVDPETFEALPAELMTFSELLKSEPGESAFHDNALAYAIFFQAGPDKYRKAYEAFKASLAATRDVEGATQEHLLSLDQEEMRTDLRRWIDRSVKIFETK